VQQQQPFCAATADALHHQLRGGTLTVKDARARRGGVKCAAGASLWGANERVKIAQMRARVCVCAAFL
jgi:hypothetical protein